MTQTTRNAPATRTDLERLLDAFFQRFPDPAFQRTARELLDKLLASPRQLAGKLGGWAGGLVYAITAWLPLRRQHVILNVELEEVFGTTMGTIRTRAEHIFRILESQLMQVHS